MNSLIQHAKFSWRSAAMAALLLASALPQAQASALVTPGAHSAPTSACALFLARLPDVGPQRCQAAQLVPSGARSRQGVPLFWRDVHTPATVPAAAHNTAAPLRVLVVGAIHGDELTSASLALHWIGLAEKMQTLGQAVHWRFIPVLNPDGLLASKPSRVNARGVDLNRNFNTPQWRRDAPLYWEKRTRKDPRRWPGPAPLSEPESQFLHAQMDAFQPQLVVSIHAPYGVLDFDGPHEPPQRLGRLRLDRVGVFPGSLGHYGGIQQGMPVVTIELDHALKMPREAEVRAMWNDLLGWMDARLLHSDTPPAVPQAQNNRPTEK
ncbi:M14 family zinc carboxypeptidase [Simplicispira psychrophila]|uniref:M14 family zinc carboxypeptidase n=1 Tax=Simplicispira psychrophila TaxID=80882 RepID=UPI001FE21C89|nr:M14 family zinc carboxypeptidase [Simplicispira psychrophila]